MQKKEVFPTGNAGDVHDGRCVARSDVAAFAEQREEGGAHEELRRDVGLEGFLPVRVLASQQVLGDGLGRGEVGFRVRGVLCVIVACDAGLQSGLSGGRMSCQRGITVRCLREDESPLVPSWQPLRRDESLPPFA